MSTRAIVGGMGAAIAVLLACLVYVAFLAGSSGASGPPGSLSTNTNCGKYRLEQRHKVAVSDAYVKGIIEIGFVEGTKSTDAAGYLRTLGTATYLPGPYRQHAYLCVKDGFEQEWVARMKTYPWVEFAHQDYASAIDTLAND